MNPNKGLYLASITLGAGESKETCNLEYYWTTEYDSVAQAAQELPNIISWLNYKRSEAWEMAIRAKRQYKEMEAEVYFELRGGEFEAKGYGKPTEKALEKAAIADPRVQEAAQKWEKWEALAEKIEGQLAALQIKIDLIRTSEATRRRIHEPMPDRNESEDELNVPRNNRRPRRVETDSSPEEENT